MPREYPDIGMAAPELAWVPTPTYLLRRASALEVIRELPPGRVLEMGCGAGALLHDLSRLGWQEGVGVELSERARKVAERVLGGDEGFTVREDLPAQGAPFDLLIAFEVLEHIEDDAAALRAWLRRLRPGGRVLVTVPAHTARWSATDVLVGHYRRYERTDVEALLEGAGLSIERIQTIGWPASWLIERVRNFAKTRSAKRSGVDLAAVAHGDLRRTQESGIERTMEARLFPYYSSSLGRLALKGAARLQRHFYRTDWGISYFAVATKGGSDA